MSRFIVGAMIAGVSWAAAIGAQAQSINVDIGPAGDAPADSYAAAGLAGHWNSIEAQGEPRVDYDIVGLDGAPTGISVYQFGGTELRVGSDPSVTGDDARLLNDTIITYTPDLENCLFVNGLVPGMYEVTMYAWMPSAPATQSRVRHDLSPMTVDVGGAWSGSHVEGITFARHILEVGSDGFLGSHSGIVPGMPGPAGASLNGFQLRHLVPGADAGPRVDAGTTIGEDSGVEPVDDAGGSETRDSGARPDAGTGGSGGEDDGGCTAAGAGHTTGAGGSIAALIVLVALARLRRSRFCS